MIDFIPVNVPLLNGNEKKYLNECIDTGWISSEGPFVKQFEEKFAGIVKRKYGIAVANGTAAIEVAVKALGIKDGDEVIMPAFTIISCAAAVIRAGAVPVLVDSDPLTWNMDINKIEEKITPRTKAIMAVHIYGLPVDMDPLTSLANKYGLKVIEDAAEAHGQVYKNEPCGSFGDISIFSFYPNKNVTSGEGGIILTDDETLAERCASLRNLCFLPAKRFVHEELGWNYRMSNLQAAVAVAQLEKLDEHLVIKKSIGEEYSYAFKGIDTIQLPLISTDYAENNYWVFGIVLKEEFPHDAAFIMKKLGEKGIGTRPFFYPMHLQPVFNKAGLFSGEKYPVAETLGERGFYIPSGLGISDEQIHKVINAVKEVLN